MVTPYKPVGHCQGLQGTPGVHRRKGRRAQIRQITLRVHSPQY
jgi:hypothetical protein